MGGPHPHTQLKPKGGHIQMVPYFLTI